MSQGHTREPLTRGGRGGCRRRPSLTDFSACDSPALPRTEAPKSSAACRGPVAASPRPQGSGEVWVGGSEFPFLFSTLRPHKQPSPRVPTHTDERTHARTRRAHSGPPRALPRKPPGDRCARSAAPPTPGDARTWPAPQHLASEPHPAGRAQPTCTRRGSGPRTHPGKVPLPHPEPSRSPPPWGVSSHQRARSPAPGAPPGRAQRWSPGGTPRKPAVHPEAARAAQLGSSCCCVSSFWGGGRWGAGQLWAPRPGSPRGS